MVPNSLSVRIISAAQLFSRCYDSVSGSEFKRKKCEERKNYQLFLLISAVIFNFQSRREFRARSEAGISLISDKLGKKALPTENMMLDFSRKRPRAEMTDFAEHVPTLQPPFQIIGS